MSRNMRAILHELSHTYEPRMKTKTLFAATFAFAHLVCQGQHPAAPSIPLNALDSYKVADTSERLESISMTRIHMQGPVSIIIDPIDNYRKADTPDACSVQFTKRRNPEYKVKFYSFRKTAFNSALNADSLNLYLNNLKQTADPTVQFEVLEIPDDKTVGPAKFRILGKRAFTMRYRFLASEESTTRSESWVEDQGRIFVVAVEAPTEFFEPQFQYIKATLNSMAYATPN